MPPAVHRPTASAWRRLLSMLPVFTRGPQQAVLEIPRKLFSIRTHSDFAADAAAIGMGLASIAADYSAVPAGVIKVKGTLIDPTRGDLPRVCPTARRPPCLVSSAGMVIWAARRHG